MLGIFRVALLAKPCFTISRRCAPFTPQPRTTLAVQTTLNIFCLVQPSTCGAAPKTMAWSADAIQVFRFRTAKTTHFRPCMLLRGVLHREPFSIAGFAIPSIARLGSLLRVMARFAPTCGWGLLRCPAVEHGRQIERWRRRYTRGHVHKLQFGQLAHNHP